MLTRYKMHTLRVFESNWNTAAVAVYEPIIIEIPESNEGTEHSIHVVDDIR